jgi:hypothetical protein
MNRYRLVLTLEVEAEAFSAQDALEAAEDNFGPGHTAGLLVTSLRVNDVAEL